MFEVITGACGELVEDDFFDDSAAHTDGDSIDGVSLCDAQTIFERDGIRHAQGTSARYDSDLL